MKDVHRCRQKMRRHDLRVEREEWEREGWKSKKERVKRVSCYLYISTEEHYLGTSTGSVHLVPSHLWAVICVEQYLKKRERMEDVTLSVLTVVCVAASDVHMYATQHAYAHTHTHTHTHSAKHCQAAMTITSRRFSSFLRFPSNVRASQPTRHSR